MRWVVAGIGFLVSIGLLLVSMTMNFQYGMSLGRDPFNSAVYGVASLCGDGLKAVLPFAIAWALAERKRIVAAAGCALFAVATLYSLASAFGFAALNRAETAGESRIEAARYESALAARERLSTERAALPSFRPVAAVEAALRAAEQAKRWRSTKRCTDATVRSSIAFCERYFALQAEAATARRAAEVDAALSKVESELSGISGRGASGQPDPQLAALADLLSVDQNAANLALLLLVTAFVELGSGLGLFVTLAHVKPRDRHAPPRAAAGAANRLAVALPAPLASDDGAWLTERIVPCEGSALLIDLYSDYAAWCQAKGRRGASPPSDLAALLEAQGFARSRLCGRETFSGLRPRLASDAVVLRLPRNHDRSLFVD